MTYQGGSNDITQTMCKILVRFAVVWIRINLDKPSSPGKGSRLNSQIGFRVL